ncbi:cytochrome P450 [Nocardia alni]|uniref:cytochrome P450 n=1 Tax=Nocardia alni TaxID=2815723 RepID=UPI001C233069|nr:cytochrome P450 [Nocardia alni]
MTTPDGVLITDFDHHSSTFAADPFAVLDELRAQAPVAWSTAYGGFWVVTGHEPAVDGLAGYQSFTSTTGPAIPAGPFGTRHIPVSLDPPEHGLYRRVLNKWYSKSEIERLEPTIKAMIEHIVKDLAERGHWDFVEDLGNVSPGAVTLGLLGWESDMRVELLRVMARGLANQTSQDPAVIAENQRGNSWIREEILARAYDRQANPRDDLMSALVTTEFEPGRVMTDEEISDTVVFLLLAGFHTTSGAFASLMVHLARHPEDRERLEADRSLIPGAIEEIVRIYSPVTSLARSATEDTELGGVPVCEGDRVLFVTMGANQDAGAFENPREVELGRKATRSVGFGWGVHRCLGLHLARTLLRLEVEAVFDLLPGYRIDLDGVRLSTAMGVGYFYDSVPASLTGQA